MKTTFISKTKATKVDNEEINRAIDYARLSIHKRTGIVISFDLCKKQSEINQTYSQLTGEYYITVTTEI